MATVGNAFCTECGRQLQPKEKFCASCGHVVAETTAKAAQPATAASPVPVPATTASAVMKPRWKKKRYWIPAVLVLLAIFGSTQGSNKKKAASSKVTDSSATSSNTPASTTSAPGVPKDVSSARSYISHHAREINTVQVMVQSVQVAVALSQKSPSQNSINQLAQFGQQAHDTIDNVRNDFALDASGSGDLGNAETEVFAAANDLKNSMGALVAYTGDSNPATLAHFSSQYQNAVSEWNDGIRIIWRTAHRRKPPVL